MNNKKEGIMTTLNVNANIDGLYELVEQLDEVYMLGGVEHREVWGELKSGVLKAKAQIDHDNRMHNIRLFLNDLGVDITAEIFNEITNKVCSGYQVVRTSKLS